MIKRVLVWIAAMFFVSALAQSPTDYTAEPGLYAWRGYAQICLLENGACAVMQSEAVFDTEADCRQAMPLLIDRALRSWDRDAVARWYCAEDRDVYNT